MNESIEIALNNKNVARLDLAINEALRVAGRPPLADDPEPTAIHFTGAIGQDYLGAGLSDMHSVLVSGKAGKFAFCGMENCECTLEENAGDDFGHSLASGLLICRGSVAHRVGAMARGGLIAVYGTAGDRAALSLRGADVVIRGNAGAMAAMNMQQGTLVIGGNAGPGLGTGMRGGVLFVRGDAKNISPDIEEHRLREPDRLKLGLLLLKSGIKATVGKEFRVYRPTSETP